MNKERLRQNIENTIYNKFRFACKSDEEFNMFMNGIKRYLKIYEDEIEDLEKALRFSCEYHIFKDPEVDELSDIVGFFKWRAEKDRLFQMESKKGDNEK